MSMSPWILVYMPAKLDEEAHNGLVSIVITSLLKYIYVVFLNFDL